MAPSEARAEDLIARRRAGSTEGAVVEVARSIRDTIEVSAAEEEGFEPGSADEGCRPEVNVARGIAAVWWRAESRVVIRDSR